MSLKTNYSGYHLLREWEYNTYNDYEEQYICRLIDRGVTQYGQR